MAMPPSSAQPVAAVHGPAVAGQPTKQVSRSFGARFGQQGASARPMTARPTAGTSSFSQGGANIGTKMSSASPSQVVTKMSDAGRAAMNAPKVPTAGAVGRGVGMLGTAARVAANPVVGGVAAAMTPTPANAGEDEKARQSRMGQSLPNVAPGQGSAKNIASVAGGSISTNAGRTTTPKAEPAKAEPVKQTFSQAFAAARAKAAEIGAKSTGSFEYGNKTYQTNLASTKGVEKYVPTAKQTKTDVKVEPSASKIDVSDLNTTTPKTTTDNTPSNAQTQTTPKPVETPPVASSQPASAKTSVSYDEPPAQKKKETMNESVVSVGGNKYRIV